MSRTALSRRAATVHLTGQRQFLDVPSRTIRTRTERMMRAAGAPLAEVSLALVDDARMTELHERWMGERRTTDVLSFPLHESPLLVLSKTPALLLGDIVVSVPVARKQARKQRREVMDEMTMLIAHGILHLLGFDHRNTREEHEMFSYGRFLEAAAVSTRAFSLSLSTTK